MDNVTVAVRILVADIQAAALESDEVGIAGDFTVSSESREPRLNVILLVSRGSEIADSDVDHMVGNIELLEDHFLILKTEVVPLR